MNDFTTPTNDELSDSLCFSKMGFETKHFFFKRFFDIAFSLMALILTLPILLIIAIVIKATSPGPILFCQKRVGRGGKTFTCYKFRTMFKDAEDKLNELLNSSESIRSEWVALRKLREDPRITPFGKFLRKSSMDELPQFLNVLLGDLSVVGPRPVVKEEITYFGSKAPKILSIRPGITGIWQVSGRNDISYTKRVEMDEMYVDSHSFFLDFRLIIKTIFKVFSFEGAY